MAKVKSKISKKAPKKTGKKVPAKKVAKPAKKAAKKQAPKKAARKNKPAKKKGETLMCFLTTACVNYYSLPDNGYELTTLRNYRDSYLASSAGGKKLISEYYRLSPRIVERVEKDTEKKSVYAYIYSEVRTACAEIENKNLPLAKKVYTTMVKTLMKRYQVS